MSPKRSINSLKTTSIKAIAGILLQTLSGDEGHYYEEVSQIFVGATFDVMEQLLEDILSEQLHDAATRVNCLQVLLREDIRKLSTGMFPHGYYLKIMEAIKLNGTGLQYLNLKGIWARENTKELSSMLANLKKLRVLISPHVVDDLVLEQIIKMDNLTSLDISGDCTYSLHLLRQFKSDTCQVLHIGNYGLKELYTACDHAESITTIASLIRNLPNLRTIRAYSYSGEALQEVYTSCSQFKSKLVHIHDTGTSSERWQAIDEVCPSLESVRLTGPKDGFITTSLDNPERKLKSLKICYPLIGELYPLITSANLPLYNLHTLHISLVRCTAGMGPAYLDISLLCTACPNLQDLECHKVQLKYAQNEDAYFIQLETVEIRYCDISINVLGFLLLNSPFLRRVVIIDNCHLTDGDIFRLCADSEFLNLEELCFAYASGLTVTSVELLMGHCPKLRYIGQLSQWNVKDTELVELSSIVQQSNVDLILA